MILIVVLLSEGQRQFRKVAPKEVKDVLDDQAIVALYNQRNERAIQETDQKYGKLLHSTSYNIVANTLDAEECVSDAYLKLWNSIPPTIPKSLKAYALKIIRNLSLNRLKFDQRTKRGDGEFQVAFHELEGILDDRSDFTDALALQDTMNRFLESLSEEQRSIFTGRYWYFESIADISHNLGIGSSKVKMTLMRCRETLKTVLKKEGYLV